MLLAKLFFCVGSFTPPEAINYSWMQATETLAETDEHFFSPAFHYFPAAIICSSSNSSFCWTIFCNIIIFLMVENSDNYASEGEKKSKTKENKMKK